MSYQPPAQDQVKQSGAEIKKKAIVDIEDMRIESDPVWVETGFPDRHRKAFAEVAKETGCVIMTRVPGEPCKDLLDEEYDAKSFHIKAKSCKSGVAAGFLCLDPLFNKGGVNGALSNLKNNHKSLTNVYEHEEDKKDNKGNIVKGKEYKASVTPLVISDKRYKWLKDKNHIVECQEDNKETFITAEMASPVEGHENIGLLLVKSMVKDTILWEVYYDLNSLYGIDVFSSNDLSVDEVSNIIYDSNDLFHLFFNKEYGAYFSEFIYYQQKERKKLLPTLLSIQGGKYEGYFPVLAMTNPYRNYKDEYTYLNAVTGDYDLFAVWPKRKEISEDDKRLQSMSPDTTDKDIINAENKALEERASTTGVSVGNISYRVYLTGQLINQKMSDGTNAKGGINRVFHSDEGGRPFVDEVDVAVAFTPEGEAYYIKDAKTEDNGEALKNFSLFCISNGYAVIINKGWSKALEDIQITWL